MIRASWTVCMYTVMWLSAAGTAHAQYGRPASSVATGERYHVEVSGDFWSPGPDMTVSSESLGIAGTNIDLVKDLGMTETRFREVRVVLRPAEKHKFRLQYIPIAYSAEATLARDLTFNGIRYRASLPVKSVLDWKAYRFGYEYDFVYRSMGFVGFIVEAKYTDVEISLESPGLAAEFAHARAPIPAIGGIARVYVAPNISITGEVTGFKLPERLDKQNQTNGRYLDIDVYSTLNFTNYIGALVGYRSIDVAYQVKQDAGDLKLKGLYFGGVVRF